MRALFFPSYRGGGFGHIGRCLALGEELARRGCEAAFVLGGPHADRVAGGGWAVIRPPSPPLAKSRRWLGSILARFGPRIAYYAFSDLNFQAVRDGYHTPQLVQQELEWSLKVVDRFRADVLVGDGWLLSSTVGRIVGLPVVQIIRAVAHPACPRLIWWRALPPQIRSPDVSAVFNPVLEHWRLPPIQRAEDLLDGDLLLVPSIPSLDPLPSNLDRTYYVGPMIRVPQQEAQPPDWCLEARSQKRPVIYVTVGGGSHSVRSVRLFPFCEKVFAGTSWEVVISTGGSRVPHRRSRSKKPRVVSWADGALMTNRADAVVFHGGYGTMMETVRAGVPSVVLPFHTEQEGNGRRLQEAGAARVLSPGDEDMRPLQARWGQGAFVALVCRQVPFRPHQVRGAIHSVLTEKGYRSSALRLQRDQAQYGGAADAAPLIESLGVF